MSDIAEARERFIRWQAVTVAQLSYSINLILTFTVAALGFGASLLLKEPFQPGSWPLRLLLLSLLLLLAAGGLGVWCTINRLRDFRATTKITRLRTKEGHDADAELNILRALTNKLGGRTWGIFWWQIGVFSAGIILLVLAVALARTT
jgi:hypothetical protein